MNVDSRIDSYVWRISAVVIIGSIMPILDTTIVNVARRPTFSAASVTMFCVGAALFGGMILLPVYWQTIRHESVVVTDLLTAPQGLGAALMMPIAGPPH